MASIFDEWDATVNGDFLNEVQGSIDNKVPYGVYECSLETCEMALTKEKRKPMLKMAFRMVEGNRSIFVNRVLEKPFQIALAVNLLKSLGTDVEIRFESYSQFAELCPAVLADAKKLKLTFEVDYRENKGYDEVSVTNVFEN